MSGGGDLRVAVFGDSFVAGVGDPEGRGWVGRVVAAAVDAGLALTAYNLGVRRETSADVLARWRAEALPRLPPGCDRRVVFSFGANDATFEDGAPRVAPETSAANLERAIDEAQGHGLAVLVVGPVPTGDAAQHLRIASLSGRFAAVAASKDVPCVEVFEALDGSAVWRAEAAAGDGAHPAGGGYELLARLLADPLLAWLASPPR